MQLVVEPEEVSVPTRDGELGLPVGFRGGLRDDRVDCVARTGAADGMRIAYGDVEGGLGCLFDRHAGLDLPLSAILRGRLDGRRDARSAV